ncbi:hypothetical protein F5B20DRAFT_297656 [Whalleya microplaca]|nr:hypothetical protein F5B20DRAFT_297656 [Whalleya microplaca]
MFFDEITPPPYSPAGPSDRRRDVGHEIPNEQPQKLQPWQKRWNKEWVSQAVIPDIRWRMDRIERRKNGLDHETIKYYRDNVENYALQVERMQPGSDKKGRCRGWRRACHRMFGSLGDLKVGYDDFRKWRQERQDGTKLWEVRAVIEDQGEDPMWEGEIIFKIRPENYAKLKENWFNFPSPENIKWFWVTDPDGLRLLQGPAAEHWGPQRNSKNCLPFGRENGCVVKNPPSSAWGTHWEVWSNFPEPAAPKTYWPGPRRDS